MPANLSATSPTKRARHTANTARRETRAPRWPQRALALASLSVALAGGAPAAALAQPAPSTHTAPLPAGGAAPSSEQAVMPAGLPSRFGIGVAAPAGTPGAAAWVGGTGLPWDYAGVTLNGGVNTGAGWNTWDPPGAFAAQFADSAVARGAVSVLTYSQLSDSAGPPCDSCGAAQRALTNLNSPEVMGPYYQEFAALMRQLGAQNGRPAVVHVEPDLSGFAMQAANNDMGDDRCFGFCAGRGNDPSLVTAAVARSSVPEVASYPDTFQGFNWALLHLRDLYAPNVLLAFHVSNWAAGVDMATNNEAWIDSDRLGTAAGAFARRSGGGDTPAGTSTYNLLMGEVASYPSGYVEAAIGQQHAWWDRNNVDLPNFDRWEQYVAAASRTAGLPVVVWQVPFGTEALHQDNRAEYFFDHVDELVQAGVVGVIFGNRLGGGTLDDDGGYLRQAVAQYKAQPRLLGGAFGPVAAASRPVKAPTTVSNTGFVAWRGSDLIIQQTDIVSSGVTLNALVQAIDADGNVAWHAERPSQPFEPGVPVTMEFTAPAAALPPGRYNVVLGLSSQSWQTLYSWSYVGTFNTGR